MYRISSGVVVKTCLSVLGIAACVIGVGLGVYHLAPSPSPSAERAIQTELMRDIDAAGEDDPDDLPENQEIITELIDFAEPKSYVNEGSSAHILIYQSHSEEAYTMTPGSEYVEASKWRTADRYNSIIRVGDALTTQLAGTYGFSVTHDTTNYERPKLATAYNRSLAGIQKNQKENPDLNVFIDVHRDAWNKSNTPNSVEIDGKQVARIMLVVGKGTDFKSPPDWESNLAFAQKVSDNLARINPKLSRGVSVKKGRCNQHVSSRSLLVEMGHNQNTLEEALNAAPYLAQAIAQALQEMGP
ncbi:MAG: stage II sporulation protein P [Eubacteriales bacterium]|nr:stage II sporulation protein P [Eubacteriales bacterium]